MMRLPLCERAAFALLRLVYRLRLAEPSLLTLQAFARLLGPDWEVKVRLVKRDA